MKIAILTLPLHTNFGGILQCYALQTVLERMGHDVTVLNTDFEKVSYKTRVGLFIKRFIKTILRKESKFYGWKTEREITRKHTQLFINKYIHIQNTTSLFLLKKDDFDAIIVGSDQIWRPLYYQPIANAYLKFAKNWTSIKRVAYAASFGTDEWEYTQQETEECASLLKLFDAISIREKSGVELCKKHFHVDAKQLVDPTFLLTKNDYLNLIGGIKDTGKKKELLCYFLDTTPEKEALANKLSIQLQLTIKRANNPKADKYYEHFEKRIQLPIEQWIIGFQNADAVITDSFHGCVFSILFNKPFLLITNINRGASRFQSLLSMLSLENRLIPQNANYKIELPLEEIDWKKVNIRLEELKKKSYSFLHQLK